MIKLLKQQQQGFTLIEMAVVMLILAFLLSAVFMPFSAQRETADIRKAREELKTIEEALYGFAIANNRLPCPTLPGNGGVGVMAGTVCQNDNGFVPSTDLGLSGNVNCDGLLLDPWGNPYRYSITNTDQDGDGNSDFVVAGEMTNQVANLTPNLRVCRNRLTACNAGTAAADVVADNVIAVYFSMGKSWQNPSNLEDENAGEGAPIVSACGLGSYDISSDRFFYSMERLETGTTFDDIVDWLSPSILYTKMLDAGLL